MMDDVPTSLGPPDLPSDWDETDSDNFRRALHLLNELVTVLVARSRSRGGQEAEQLHAEELRYADERQRLSVVNRAEVTRILTDYPARLQELKQDRR